MDFLEICKRARRETRIPGEGPTTVLSQTGLLGDVVAAVQEAWLEIQLTHFESWSFLREVREVELTPGTNEYALGDLDIYDSARVVGVTDEKAKPLKEYPWGHFIRNTIPGDAEPKTFSVSPSGILVFGDRPLDATKVRVEYIREMQTLNANTDVPAIADHHHRTILWKAVMDLAANESDSVIYQKAYEKFENGLSRMMGEYLPPVDIRATGARFL